MLDWTNYNNELYHHGILGQKWGVRRFQNPDGSLTSAGRLRYNEGSVGIIKANPIESRSTRRKINKEISELEKTQKKYSLKYGKKADRLRKKAIKTHDRKKLEKAAGYYERGSEYVRQQEILKLGLSSFTKQDFKDAKRYLSSVPKKSRDVARKEYLQRKAIDYTVKYGVKLPNPVYDITDDGIRELTVEEILKR